MKKRTRERQRRFDELGWGGFREGAGRKKSRDSGVRHDKRAGLSRHHPVHVTLRVKKDLPSLRSRRCFRAITAAMSKGRERFGMRLVHHSVQGNHIHLIVEAEDARSLGRGMQGLCIRIAKGLNRILGRLGSVFADRFHTHVLKTPSEVRRALAYVLNNWRKHAAERGRHYAKNLVDLLSSAPWFNGWRSPPANHDPPEGTPRDTTAEPRGYLLRTGWRRRGLLDTGEVPGGRRAGR